MKTRIIGCGNPQRQDDAAGVLVARRLRELGVPTEIQSGGAFELISSWDEPDHIVLVDAVATGSVVGTVHLWEGRPPRLPGSSQFSSHGFGLAEAFRLGQLLNCLPAQITVYGIEGRNFGMGEAVSTEVLAAVDRVALEILDRFPPRDSSIPEAARAIG